MISGFRKASLAIISNRIHLSHRSDDPAVVPNHPFQYVARWYGNQAGSDGTRSCSSTAGVVNDPLCDMTAWLADSILRCRKGGLRSRADGALLLQALSGDYRGRTWVCPLTSSKPPKEGIPSIERERADRRETCRGTGHAILCQLSVFYIC
jgi:hypothetical protein